MRIIHHLGFLVLVLIAVSAAPATDLDKTDQEDAIEQELIRQHHSTQKHADESEDGNNSYSSDNIDDESSPIESIEDIPDDVSNGESQELYNEDNLYDITVGDVIRDVLLTLSEHPEIVKELDMERRKDKIAQKLAGDPLVSVAEDLTDLQGPAEQLVNEPKRVQKKDGKSGISRATGVSHVNGLNADGGDDGEISGFMNHKRKDEVLDETFSPETESSDSLDSFDAFKEFMESRKGADNKYRKLYGGESEDESGSYDYRRHFADKSASGDSSSMEDMRAKFRLPFLNPFSMYKHHKLSESSDSSSQSEASDNSSSKVKDENAGSDVSETESDESENSQSSEEQLSWLQRQMESNKKMERSQRNM